MTGVSRATVSRVVNDSPRVSPTVRLRVQAAVEQLGYTPNRAARSLVTRRSDSVAVVIAQPAGQVFADPFFPRLLRGISSVLAANDLQLILLMPESPADERRVADYVMAGHVDGALLVSLHESDSLPARLTDSGLRLVVLGRPPRDSQVSYVDADNRQGAYAAVAHLVATGRRVIATITGPLDTAPGIDRLQGYRDALARRGRAVGPNPGGRRGLHAGGQRQGDGAAAGDPSGDRCGIRRIRPDGGLRAVRHHGIGTPGAGRYRPRRLRRHGHRVVHHAASQQRPSTHRGDGTRDGAPARRVADHQPIPSHAG